VADHLAEADRCPPAFQKVGKCNAGLGHRGALPFRDRSGNPT
jgi:hypothetical protein